MIVTKGEKNRTLREKWQKTPTVTREGLGDWHEDESQGEERPGEASPAEDLGQGRVRRAGGQEGGGVGREVEWAPRGQQRGRQDFAAYAGMTTSVLSPSKRKPRLGV